MCQKVQDACQRLFEVCQHHEIVTNLSESVVSRRHVDGTVRPVAVVQGTGWHCVNTGDASPDSSLRTRYTDCRTNIPVNTNTLTGVSTSKVGHIFIY